MTLSKPTDDLIAEIYEAALEPCGWDAVLTKISDQLKGAAIIADVRSDPNGVPIGFFAKRFEAERLLASIEEFSKPGANPTLDHMRRSATVGTFFDRRQILDDTAFERNDISRTVLFPQGLYETTASALDRRPDRLSVMALARARAKDPFSDDEISYLGSLSGHIRRSLELTARALEYQIANHYLDSILESLPHAAFAVDENWRVLGANACASGLLSCGALFDYKANRISLSDAKQQQMLLAAMASAEGRACGLSPNSRHCIATARGQPDQRSQISVLRCDRPTSTHTAGKTIFLLLIRPINTINPELETIIRDCFALTPSEARLAAVLSRTGTLEETLTLLTITRNTAKTHLRRIFRKTSTRNQVELVRLISALQAA